VHTRILRLPTPVTHLRLMRLDTASIFKRFFYLERALTVAMAAWIPDVRRLESKAAMARGAWQNAMTADALRNRVFELKYPDRSLDRGQDAWLIRLFEAASHAPSGGAVLELMAAVLVPAVRRAYEEYLESSDAVADGPTYRFLELAIKEKEEQESALRDAAGIELGSSVQAQAANEEWNSNVRTLLEKLGGVGLEPAMVDVDIPEIVEPGRAFRLREDPARDEAYIVSEFYWPDNFDPNYPYGLGLRLQVRSAISHVNEVWAVETAGAVLQGLADSLEWEWIPDAARWLYDESRHMLMGKRRLEWWGFDPSEVPLGNYIYDSCRGQDVIYRLGMLAYFETKNIGKKRDRAEEFHDIGDDVSERDMDFDWADEAIHASFGRKWMKRALEARGRRSDEWADVVRTCEELVAARVARATEEEKKSLTEVAERLLAKAERMTAAS
jgi:hypothetical protein